MKEPPKFVTKVLIGNGIKHPNWIWTILLPFAWVGSAIYVIIGLPVVGLIGGWLIARDEVMGHDHSDPPSLDQLNNACLSYRHDFGLLSPEDKNAIQHEALAWLQAWQKSEENK